MLVDLIEENDSWESPALRDRVPLLAGLSELLFWLRHRHRDANSASGRSLAGDFAGYIEQWQRGYELTDAALEAWRPPNPGEIVRARTLQRREWLVRWQYAAKVSRIWPVVLVQTNGLGSPFHPLVQRRTAASSSVTLRSAERHSLRLVSLARPGLARSCWAA